MPIARPGYTRPLPRPQPWRRGRAARTRGAGQSLAQLLGTWNFTALIYLSFDGPTAATPAWLEVTEFVEVETSTITITRGRQDGLSDVAVGRAALTVDNSDGRWTPSNPAGAWFGLIRKGCWLRIDLLPPSGVVSTRFVGFITALPTGWQGLYAFTQITASDRFLLLGQAPQYATMVEQEALSDAAGAVQCYYALTDASGSLTAGDTSGALNPTLTQQAIGGVPLGTGLAFSSIGGPGFDGQQAPAFTPVSATQGTCLAGTLPAAGTGVWATKISCWFNTTYQNNDNPIFSLTDPSTGAVVTVLIDFLGYFLDIYYTWLNPNGPATTVRLAGFNLGGSVNQFPQLNDGRWHHISVILWPYAGARGIAFGPALAAGASWLDVFQDGRQLYLDSFAPTSVFGANANPTTSMTQLVVGGGMSLATRGLVATFTGSISDFQVSYAQTQAQGNAMLTEPAPAYTAAATGFNSESVDQRLGRLARYAGIPAVWTNFAPAIHLCGTQSIIGRAPLDVLREAARTENMPLYVDRPGRLAIQPSTARYNTASAWSVDARDLDPATAFTDDYSYLVNQVAVSVNNGGAQTVNGTAGLASQAKYGIYSQSLATANLNPTDAANAALAQVGANADPVPRIASLVLEAATLAKQPGYGNAWYDSVLATDNSTLATITNLPPQAPASSLSVFVEGYTETIGAGQHLFAFSTSPQANASVFQLDSSTLDTPAITLPY